VFALRHSRFLRSAPQCRSAPQSRQRATQTPAHNRVFVNNSIIAHETRMFYVFSHENTSKTAILPSRYASSQQSCQLLPRIFRKGRLSALTSFITLTCNFVLEWCDKIKLSNLLLPRKGGTIKSLQKGTYPALF
jgi:hypothetical protein